MRFSEHWDRRGSTLYFLTREYKYVRKEFRTRPKSTQWEVSLAPFLSPSCSGEKGDLFFTLYMSVMLVLFTFNKEHSFLMIFLNSV